MGVLAAYTPPDGQLAMHSEHPHNYIQTPQLHNIPALGFGTFQDPDSQEETVSRALQKGMRLIDTARVYDVLVLALVR